MKSLLILSCVVRACLLGALVVLSFPGMATPPTILLQPGVVTATAGTAASFTVSASGAGPLGYQWRRLGVPLVGADQPVLTLPAVTIADAGFYDVVVTDGADRMVSQAGRLLVAPAALANVFRADPGFSFIAEAGSASVAVTTITGAGAVLVGGNFTTIAGGRRDGLARFLPATSPQPAFVLDATFAPVVSGAVFAIAALADGRILIGGGFTHVNGVPRRCIARLNADGTLDETFFPGTGFDGNVYALAPQPDGTVIVGGWFASADGVARGGIARLGADGALDAGFGGGAGFNGRVQALARQSDGRIVAAGAFTAFAGTTANRIARLDVDGTLDFTFASGGGCNAPVEALACVAGDALLVGGSFTSYDGVAAGRVMRLAADGARDTSFVSPASLNGAVHAIAPAAGGRVWVAGDFNGFVARLNAGGSVDSTWNPTAAIRPNTSVLAVVPFADGRLAVGGLFTQLGTVAGSAGGLVWYGTGASLLVAPGGGFRQGGIVTAAAPVADGRWVVAGTFTHVNGVPRRGIARILSDGTLDTAFDPGTGFGPVVAAVIPLGDGRVLVAGSFSVFNGVPVRPVVRLTAVGALDAAFSLDGGIVGAVAAAQVQADGRIVIGGGFSTVYGGARSSVARLWPDGALDEGFDIGSGPSGSVHALALQRDGAVVVAGGFAQLNGIPRFGAARFGATGALDTAFNAGAGFDAFVDAVVVRADDTLLCAGAFQHFAGAPRPLAAAFTASGGLSTSYNAAGGLLGAEAYGALALPDGRVMLSGNLAAAGGQSANGLVRLGAEGTPDSAFAVFDLSIGSNGGVAVTDDGRLLVLSTTAAHAGGRQVGLVRLCAGPSPLPVIIGGPASQTVPVGAAVSFTVAAGGAPTLRYQWRRSGVDLPGATTPTLALASAVAADAGEYSVRVRNDHGWTDAAATLVVTAGLNYAGWTAANFTPGELGLPAVSGAGADPDGAGISNLVRYAFGLPARGTVAPPTVVTIKDEGGVRYLAIEFNRAAAADDLLYTVQSSGDLKTWATVATLRAGNPQEQTVRDDVPLGSASRRFLRVQVELAP